MTKPVEGQSLISYLTSQDFNTCANLEKENAHFHIAEALITAFESMNWNRMMKRVHPSRKHKSASTSSEEIEEEVKEIRQRIRIRKRERMLEKSRPVSLGADRGSQGASSDGSGSENDEQQIDLTMSSSEAQGSLSALRSSGLSLSMASLYSVSSSEAQGSLSALRSSGLSLSMASLYSEIELQKRNQQLERNSTSVTSTSTEEQGGNKGSAEAVAISLLRKFSEKSLPKASELRWLVSERDAPQAVAYMKRYRYCEYLGKYFCQCCHTGETSAIIPGRVLERWDFARYPVSAFSHSLLDRMWLEPLFHVSTINPSLYKRVKALESIREGRRQLVHLHSLLVVCRRDARIIKELHKLPAHWVSNEDAYSMDDFTQVKSGVMLNIIKSFILLAVAHIDTCPLCQGLGFICEMCNNPRVIFPFQLDTVVSCPVFMVVVLRLTKVILSFLPFDLRRKLRKVQLSPESPEADEITLQTSQQTDHQGALEGPHQGHSITGSTVDQTAGSR
ncbi:RUN domain Beclin-1 interacting and cysteine-rich containing protein-like [Elysia marginata]|uniref:RUN domain Beclin-1 interacting and cysteine-rich containing protein-like n=1 Tax=Elysia marginata TaxID=1093978 RepID=A0AAV4G2L4_9GAST|nr:RUN domain Beclin-1 interacting and cysteine-rich containing protein-like [Elysia marginata]